MKGSEGFLPFARKYLESTVGSEVKSQISFNSYDVKYIQWRAKMETLLRKKEVGKAYALQAQAVYSDHLVYNQLIVQIASDALELNKNVEEQKRRSQLMAKAQVLYTKLAENNLHINSETFNVLLKLFSSTGNHKRCRSYIWKMHRHSIPVTAQHYYYYIDAYCKSGSVILARDAVGEMLQWKIQPSLKIFYRMIEAFLNQSPPNFDKAFAYLKAAPRMKIFVDERMMKLFIKRLSKLNTVDKLELSQIWCNLLFSTIPPNALVCNYMMLVGLELKRFDIVDEYYLLLCRSTASTDRQSELLYFKSLFLRKDFVGCKNLLRNMPELADCAEALEIISNLSFETHDHHLK